MARGASNGSLAWLALLIGLLVLAVTVIAYVAFAGREAVSDPRVIDLDIDIPRPPPIPHAPRLPDAPIPTPK